MTFTPPPLDSLEPENDAAPAGAGGGKLPVISAPVTFYSLGASVGGPDELEDKWTNKGYSAKGPNLTPGIAAVNPKVIPHGTVLRDTDTGLVFLASDSHGNADSGVVDLYVPPDAYQPAKVNRNFEVVGKVDRVPTTPDAVREVLSQYGQVPAGESALETLQKRQRPKEGGNEFRRTNGVWGQVDPQAIDWTEEPNVIDEQVPRAERAFTPPPLDSLEPDGSSAGGFVPPPLESLEPEDAVAEKPRSFVDLARDVRNQFARGATSDGGIFSMTEGAARMIAGQGLNPYDDGQPDADLVAQRADLVEQLDAADMADAMQAEGGGSVNPEIVGLQTKIKQIDRALEDRKNLEEKLGGVMRKYADDVANVRSGIREALPVTPEFQNSLAGGIVAGFGQIPAALASYSVPGFGPLAAAGGVYDEAYQDALQKTGDPAQAHKAGLIAVPSGALDVLGDKFVLGKMLKPLKGKLTVGQLAKMFAVTAPVGGGTEGLQQGWLNFSAKYLAGYDPNRKLDQEVIDSILIGGIVDSTVSTGGAAVVNATQKSVASAGGETQPAATGGRAVGAAQVNVPVVDAAAEAEAFGGEGDVMSRDVTLPDGIVDKVAASVPSDPKERAVAAAIATDKVEVLASGPKIKGDAALLTKLPEPDISSLDGNDLAPLDGPEADRAISLANDSMRDRGLSIRPVAAGELDASQRTDAARLARAVAGLFGRRVVVFETDAEEFPNNAFVNTSERLKDYIFVYNRATRPHMLTIGHELFHSIEVSSKPLADQIKRELGPMLRNMERLRKEKPGYEDDRIVAEGIGDLFGDSLADPEFWKGLQARNAKLFEKLATVVQAWLAKVQVALRKLGFGSSEYFTDIERARAIAADALAQFAENPQGKIGPYLPEDLNQNVYSEQVMPQDSAMPEEKRAAKTSGQPSPGGRVAEAIAQIEKIADESSNYDEFKKATRQSHLMDLSRPETHWIGRALPSYKGEPYEDIQQFIDEKSAYLEDIKYTDRQIYAAITSPKKTITVYRAVPADRADAGIRIGDYVALTRRYAQMHLESVLEAQQGVKGKIISEEIPKRDVIWGQADWQEWAYSPRALREAIPSLEEFYASRPNPSVPSDGAEYSGMRKPELNAEAGLVVADIPQEIVDYGVRLYQAGIDFARWSARMVARFGREVQAKLRDLWSRIVAHQRRLPWAGERGSVIVPDGSSPEKRRKFIASAKAAEAVAPSVRERVEGVYTPITNEATVAEAVSRINRDGLDRVLADLLSVDAPTAADYAAGIELIPRLQAGSRFEDAVALIERMAERATGQGQAIQALSLMGRLTAEGVQVYAEKVTGAAVKDNPTLDAALKEIKRLRGDLRKARHQLASRAILDAKRKGSNESVQDRLKRLLTSNKGSLWGRYREQAVNELAAKMLPGAERKPAALEEFTRRLTRMLREQLPKPQTGAVDRGPQLTEAELIGEAVRNLDKYREVWEAAQAEVQARLRDNPEALQSLDDYLGQVLTRPFSEASVGRAVKQTLQKLNVSMREVLMQGAGDKEVILRELTRRISMEARLSENDAAGLAKAVHAEYERGQKAAREELLRQMTAVRDPRLPVSKLKKLMGLNNAGALDDGRFFTGLAKAYGIPVWTEELSRKVAALQRDYERAENPEVKLAKAAQIFDAIHSVVPPAALAKVRALQNMAMLLNPKTIIRNVAGNVLLFAADVAADAVTVTVVDPLVSVVTGKRVRRSVDVGARLRGLAHPVRDYWNGYDFARQGGASKAASAAEGIQTLLTLARLQSRGKWDISQLNKGEIRVLTSRAGKLLEDTLATVLSVPDRAFHQAAFQASIARQMENAAAEGRKMVGPDAAMVEEAMMDAARAVFQDPNAASYVLRQIQKGLNLGKDWGIGSVIIPFTQVPGSILTMGVQWSPLGFIGAAYEMIRPTLKREDFRQKEFTDGFSRALLGSGVAAAGAWLFALGIITALEDEDKDLEAMRRASGLGKYLINVSALKRAMMTGNWWTKQVAQDGDVTVNYDWAQPNAMAVAMGAAAIQKRDEMRRMTKDGLPAAGGALEIAGSAAMGAALTLESQPLLTGLAGLGRDVGRDGLLAGVGQQALGVPGMFVPTFVRQVGQMMDNQMRETRAGSVLDQTVARLEASIPGLAAKYPPKYDVYGDAVQRYNYGGNSLFNVMINPAFVGQVKRSRELREMERVFSASGDRGVLLERAPVKVTVKGMDAELTNEQISQYQREAGQLSMAMAARLMAAPNYARAPIGVKAEVLAKVFDRVNNAVKLRTVLGNPDLVQELRSQAAARAEADRVMAGVQ